MIIYLCTAIVLNVIALLAMPAAVGKERKPLSVGWAAFQSLCATSIIVFATVALLRGWAV